MSLKHNPFDNTFKGSLIRRKSVFDTLPTELSDVNEEQTKQNQTELNITKQNQTIPLLLQNITEQDITDSTKQNKTEQNNTKQENQTKLNSTQNKEPNKTKPNRTEQFLARDEGENKLLALTGNRKKVTLAVYNLALETVDGEIEISYEMWCELAQISKTSIKTTVRQLRIDNYFRVLAPRGGRGAILTVTIDQGMLLTYSKLYQKLNKKLNNTPNKGLPIVVVPNSLSLKTTNTETPNFDAPCFVIPNELSGMVSRRQLSQFVLEEKISEYELQMSLDAFAFDLRNKLVSTKHTANPVGLLIGAIKNNGGYNSQKFAEALKSEMKTALSSQQTLEDSISEAKEGEGWAKYQEIKNSSPEAFQALISKYEKQGLKGDLLEEFGFLEFQDQERAQKMKLSDA